MALSGGCCDGGENQIVCIPTSVCTATEDRSTAPPRPALPCPARNISSCQLEPSLPALLPSEPLYSLHLLLFLLPSPPWPRDPSVSSPPPSLFSSSAKSPTCSLSFFVPCFLGFCWPFPSSSPFTSFASHTLTKSLPVSKTGAGQMTPYASTRPYPLAPPSSTSSLYSPSCFITCYSINASPPTHTIS